MTYVAAMCFGRRYFVGPNLIVKIPIVQSSDLSFISYAAMRWKYC